MKTYPIDLIYRADGSKGANDGGTIRKACKATCTSIQYSPAGITAHLVNLDLPGQIFAEHCPNDCLLEVIGVGSTYQAEVSSYTRVDVDFTLKKRDSG